MNTHLPWTQKIGHAYDTQRRCFEVSPFVAISSPSRSIYQSLTTTHLLRLLSGDRLVLWRHRVSSPPPLRHWTVLWRHHDSAVVGGHLGHGRPAVPSAITARRRGAGGSGSVDAGRGWRGVVTAVGSMTRDVARGDGGERRGTPPTWGATGAPSVAREGAMTGTEGCWALLSCEGVRHRCWGCRCRGGGTGTWRRNAVKDIVYDKVASLTLARTSYFATLDRTWGGGHPPGSLAP